MVWNMKLNRVPVTEFKRKRKLKLNTISPQKAKKNIVNDLKLIKGIGDSKSEYFKVQWY